MSTVAYGTEKMPLIALLQKAQLSKFQSEPLKKSSSDKMNPRSLF